MKLKQLAGLAVKLLALYTIAGGVLSLGIIGNRLYLMSLAENLKVLVTVLSFPLMVAIILWMLSDWIAKVLVSHADGDCEVKIALSEDALLRVVISAIGVYIFVISIPSFFYSILHAFNTPVTADLAQAAVISVSVRSLLIDSLHLVLGAYLMVGARQVVEWLNKLQAKIK